MLLCLDYDVYTVYAIVSVILQNMEQLYISNTALSVGISVILWIVVCGIWKFLQSMLFEYIADCSTW